MFTSDFGLFVMLVVIVGHLIWFLRYIRELYDEGELRAFDFWGYMLLAPVLACWFLYLIFSTA